MKESHTNLSATEWGRCFSWVPLSQFEIETKPGRLYDESDSDYQIMLERQIRLISDLQELMFGHFGVDDEFDFRNKEYGACVSDNLWASAAVTAYVLGDHFSLILLEKIRELLQGFSEFEINFGLDVPDPDADYIAHLNIGGGRLIAALTGSD